MHPPLGAASTAQPCRLAVSLRRGRERKSCHAQGARGRDRHRHNWASAQTYVPGSQPGAPPGSRLGTNWRLSCTRGCHTRAVIVERNRAEPSSAESADPSPSPFLFSSHPSYSHLGPSCQALNILTPRDLIGSPAPGVRHLCSCDSYYGTRGSHGRRIRARRSACGTASFLVPRKTSRRNIIAAAGCWRFCWGLGLMPRYANSFWSCGSWKFRCGDSDWPRAVRRRGCVLGSVAGRWLQRRNVWAARPSDGILKCEFGQRSWQ